MTDAEVAIPRIVYIDDDDGQLTLVERFLSGRYHLITSESGRAGLTIINEIKPDLILLDINMPDMNGYEVCARLQEWDATAYTPVVFVTAMGEERNRARAFAVGAADFLVKPVKRKDLIDKIETHLATNASWRTIRTDGELWHEKLQSSDFIGFKEYVSAQMGFDAEKKYFYSKTAAEEIYPVSHQLGIGESTLSRFISRFLKMPHISKIPPDAIRMGVLPILFCKVNHVLPIYDASGGKSFVLSNPFNPDLIQMLVRVSDLKRVSVINITEPGKLEGFFAETSEHRQPSGRGAPVIANPSAHAVIQEKKGETHPVVRIANTILAAAMSERASDIHIEPKESETMVRFRVDGDMRHAFTLKKNTGIMLISRLKAQGGIDISEKRKPQDGGFATNLSSRVVNFRLSTTSTPNGESLVMRLLEPYAKSKMLVELGLSARQAEIMSLATGKSTGIILVVGATGSGKTTTIYSLLHAIDYRKRSIMSVEDPVEYRIPFVNQQQVNERAGVSFEALLKASVRQDPDVLFMGEVRDGFSAKMAIDFASTGHLTITTLHTSNATTAIFRLQRLGIDRDTMADTIIAVVAQKLLKKLCPHCKRIEPISREEAQMLSAFTDEIPSSVAHPVGCPECRNSGYLGREGVYEVLEFDPQIAAMVRSGAPISEIRLFSRNRGDYLISTHAVAKVRELIFDPRDVFEKVLAEEVPAPAEPVLTNDAMPISTADTVKHSPPAVLLVDDDEDMRKLVTRFLESDGYAVSACEDGIDALLSIGNKKFDLILSDINMPNLDGFKLMEMLNQKGIDAPVILMTSRTDTKDEEKGLALGAADYLKKPVTRDLLRLRINGVLKRREQ